MSVSARRKLYNLRECLRTGTREDEIARLYYKFIKLSASMKHVGKQKTVKILQELRGKPFLTLADINLQMAHFYLIDFLLHLKVN